MSPIRIRPRVRVALLALAAATLAAGCGSSMRPTRFTNPKIDFSFVERVAVLPFENYSNDAAAGPRATRLFLTELLATGAVDVVEPGEVSAALARYGGGARAVRPSTEQIVELGKTLGVQAVIAGAVAQSEVLRSGSAGIPTITLDAQMIEAESGGIIWSATHTEKGSAMSARFLGNEGEPLSVTTRRCVKRLVATLVK
ncbi:MAG: penicillin-binding protein activator LpoB [Thermoanaerobaculia bacterium]|nr:penicillin-binding protein activator LpoB [Thermoanaerobaculia bacterium]